MTERHVRHRTRIGCVDQGRSRITIRFGMTLAGILSATSPVGAACKLPLSQASLEGFTDHPARYLDRYPTGGKELAFAVRNFASFNRFGLKGVAAMVQTANLLQKTAIGRGLAGAVNACIPRDGEVARQIADVVKSVADRDIIEAYLAAADDGTSPSASTAALDPDRAQGSISLGLDRSTTLTTPDVPTIALPPPKN